MTAGFVLHVTCSHRTFLLRDGQTTSVMQRPQYYPEWGEPHLLSFVTDASGESLAVHADLAGITMLIDELEILRRELEQGDCPHAHLFSFTSQDSALTTTKLAGQETEVNIVRHVKIYGWNEEWARRHGLRQPATG